MGKFRRIQAMLDFIGKHNIRPVVDKIFKIEDFKKKLFDRLGKRQQFW